MCRGWRGCRAAPCESRSSSWRLCCAIGGNFATTSAWLVCPVNAARIVAPVLRDEQQLRHNHVGAPPGTGVAVIVAPVPRQQQQLRHNHVGAPPGTGVAVMVAPVLRHEQQLRHDRLWQAPR
jgi:hypothetical protein